MEEHDKLSKLTMLSNKIINFELVIAFYQNFVV